MSKTVTIPCGLSLFGAWKLEIAGKTAPFQGLRERALMALLVLEAPSILLRKDIADMLWPGSDASRARASLRQTIASIKKALAQQGVATCFLESISLGGDFVALTTEIELLEDPDQDPATLKKLLDRVTREETILDGLDDLGPAFGDWLTLTRSRLAEHLKARLWPLAEDPGQPGDIRIRAAEAALRLNEYDERAVRAKMAGFVALAENGRALKTYADFVELLDEELGAEPSLKTQDLAVEIKMAVDGPTPRAPAPPAQAARNGPVSLAVLPFTATGSDPVSKYDILGISDQLTCLLAMNRAPAVISSNSTQGYFDRTVRLREVREELGASYVVTGSARSDGDNVAFAVQLSDTRSEHIIWSFMQTCARDEVITINDDIAQRISHALSPSVNAAELSRTSQFDNADLEPYHLILRAKDRMFQMTRDGFTEAGHLLQEAVRKGPDYAPAYALLADWYSIRYWQRWSNTREGDFDQMNEHVQRAVQLAPNDGRIMAMWGHFRIILERNYDAALELFSKAVSLNPNDSETLNWSVPTLAYSGHSELALENARRALRLSPHDPFLFRNEHFLSIAHYANGDFDTAAQYGLSSFTRVPSYTSNIRTTIASIVAAGRTDDLSELVAAHAAAEPDFSTRKFVPNHGFRHGADKELYGERLISGGLPH